MTRDFKLKFTSGMLILICVNIILEILSGLLTFIIMTINKIKNIKKKKENEEIHAEETDKLKFKNKSAKMKVKVSKIKRSTKETQLPEKELPNNTQSSRITLSRPKKTVRGSLFDLTAPQLIVKDKTPMFMNNMIGSRRMKSTLNKKTFPIKKYSKIGSSKGKIESVNKSERASSRGKLNDSGSTDTVEFNRSFRNKVTIHNSKTPMNGRRIKIGSPNNKKSISLRKKKKLTIDNASKRKIYIKEKILSRKQKSSFPLGSGGENK